MEKKMKIKIPKEVKINEYEIKDVIEAMMREYKLEFKLVHPFKKDDEGKDLFLKSSKVKINEKLIIYLQLPDTPGFYENS
jgi:hypothetical protein